MRILTEWVVLATSLGKGEIELSPYELLSSPYGERNIGYVSTSEIAIRDEERSIYPLE